MPAPCETGQPVDEEERRILLTGQTSEFSGTRRPFATGVVDRALSTGACALCSRMGFALAVRKEWRKPFTGLGWLMMSQDRGRDRESRGENKMEGVL